MACGCNEAKTPDVCKAGTELKKIFAPVRRITEIVNKDADCGCDDTAALMDRQGCEWCFKNVGAIANRIKTNANKLGLPYNRVAAMAAIRLSVFLAKRNLSHVNTQG